MSACTVMMDIYSGWSPDHLTEARIAGREQGGGRLRPEMAFRRITRAAALVHADTPDRGESVKTQH
jgi:hypothetical protein